jgi:hypothetical protein
MLVSEEGDTDTMKILLDSGANIRVKISVQTLTTPL